MFKKKCRCGKTEKNFKFDIGEFFMNECCFDSGYDDMGRKKEEKVELKKEVKEEKVESKQEEAPKKKRRSRKKKAE